MKTCPNCGAQYSDNWDTCPRCSGAKRSAGSGSYAGDPYSSSGQYTMKNKSGKTAGSNKGTGNYTGDYKKEPFFQTGKDFGRAVEDLVDDVVEDVGNHLNDFGSELEDMVQSGIHRGSQIFNQTKQTYRQQGSTYGRPGQTYDQPGSTYGRPGQTYGQQGSTYGRPGQTYGQSGSSYDRPGQTYGQSGSSYGRSGQSYGTTGQPYGRPGHSGMNRGMQYRQSPNRQMIKQSYPFYEQIWFIIFCLICFFPVGVVLLIMRNSHKRKLSSNADFYSERGACSENRAGGSAGAGMNPVSPPSRKNRILTMDHGVKIRSIVLLGLGAVIGADVLVSPNLDELMYILPVSLLMIGFGIYPFLKIRRKRKIYALYESLIDNRGNTRLDYVAGKVRKSLEKTRIMIQKMLSEGFLSEPENEIAAYINGRYDMIVVTYRGRPIVPIEETLEKEGIRMNSMEEEESAADEASQEDHSASSESQIIAAIDEMMEKQRTAYNKGVLSSEAEETGAILMRIRASLEQIVLLLEERPESEERKDVRNMETRYIPYTISLIEKYQRPSSSPELRHQITGMLGTLERVYDNIEEKLRKQEEDNFEIDMEVMRKILESDGILGSDFKIE